MLLDAKRNHTGKKDDQLNAWDFRFYEHELKEKWKSSLDLKHDFHKYFPLDHVI